MYHPEVVDRNLHKLEKLTKQKFHRYSIDESIARQEHLGRLMDEDGKLIREPKQEEEEFILNEMQICRYDFRYWANRYAFLNSKDSKLQRIKFWESQEIALQHIAEGELEGWKMNKDNLWIWLKARQLGATAICEASIGHRLFFRNNQRAVIASDDPDHSVELSRRVELIFKMLPWWMKPHREFNVKGTEMFFNLSNCSLVIGHGRKEGGGIGQGQTTNIFHFTEIPDWLNTDQIDEDFLPTVPILPTSVGFMESTARGRYNWWHKAFQRAWDKKSRFSALFIPWYTERETYALTPPIDWEPAKITLEHAKNVKSQSPLYCLGKTVNLTKEQLYWWEKNYTEYKESGDLWKFHQEYAADHMEAFQSSTMSLFNSELISDLQQHIQSFSAYEVVSTT